MTTKEILVQIKSIDDLTQLFGSYDSNIKLIEQHFSINVITRENQIKLKGEEQSVLEAEKLIVKLISMIQSGEEINEQAIRYMLSLVVDKRLEDADEISKDVVCVTSKGKVIKPKTSGQRHYINTIKNNTIVFGIGPAGTGKTYLAMAMAIKAFKNKEVSRIILTRPAVEAGEKLGFLPGDLQDKVDPYLRPLYDALYDIMGTETYLKHLERGAIEVAPLAYMRGRTLDDCFIILDEAQNTTPQQMKMFLTRLGFGSKAIITGDVTQVDLPRGKESGLKEAAKILEDVNDIGIVNLTERDVVRHNLVQKIIQAYSKYEEYAEQKQGD
jgi:phosphate starvation-inducible protein PhoH and related proteins